MGAEEYEVPPISVFASSTDFQEMLIGGLGIRDRENP